MSVVEKIKGGGPLPGYSKIEPTAITFDYPTIDLEKKLVIARVLFKGEVKMQVTFDLQNNTVHKKGSIGDLATLTGISRRMLDEQKIVESLRSTALFYIENHISDPE